MLKMHVIVLFALVFSTAIHAGPVYSHPCTGTVPLVPANLHIVIAAAVAGGLVVHACHRCAQPKVKKLKAA